MKGCVAFVVAPIRSLHGVPASVRHWCGDNLRVVAAPGVSDCLRHGTRERLATARLTRRTCTTVRRPTWDVIRMLFAWIVADAAEYGCLLTNVYRTFFISSRTFRYAARRSDRRRAGKLSMTRRYA
jgi:hypothetical protein